MVVPTDYGQLLKKLYLPSTEEFQQRVEGCADQIALSMAVINDPVRGVSDAERYRLG